MPIGVSATILDTLLAAAQGVMNFMGTVVETAVNNPVLAFFFAISITGGVIGLFRRFRKGIR